MTAAASIARKLARAAWEGVVEECYDLAGREADYDHDGTGYRPCNEAGRVASALAYIREVIDAGAQAAETMRRAAEYARSVHEDGIAERAEACAAQFDRLAGGCPDCGTPMNNASGERCAACSAQDNPNEREG